MTKRVFYEKIGRKYVPVAEYNHEFIDKFPKGASLIMCKPGGQSRRYNIEPALAPLIAAGEYALDSVSQTIYKATELRPERKPLTKEQRENWQRLTKSLGAADSHLLTYGSARDAAQAGIDVMIKEAEKTLSNPAVRKAYEHFMTVYQLAKQSE